MAVVARGRAPNGMNLAQALAAAALVPTLVVLIAANYHGAQQAQALGILAGTPAISGALAFFVAGLLGTWLSWRYSFGLLFFLSLVVFLLSFRLKPIPRQTGIKIDFTGAALAAIGIILLSLCLLYTSDAADERSSVDLGGRRIINKKRKHKNKRECRSK